MRVLFVCLGNICRSPTAEGVLRQQLLRVGLSDRVQVASAGTGEWHIGKPPDSRTLKAAARRGYDFCAQRAQQVTAAHFAEYDLILAMDLDNLADLKRLQPAQGRAELDLFLRRYDGLVDEVPDPYYEGEQGFERVLDLIEAGCEGLVRELKGRV